MEPAQLLTITQYHLPETVPFTWQKWFLTITPKAEFQELPIAAKHNKREHHPQQYNSLMMLNVILLEPNDDWFHSITPFKDQPKDSSFKSAQKGPLNPQFFKVIKTTVNLTCFTMGSSLLQKPKHQDFGFNNPNTYPKPAPNNLTRVAKPKQMKECIFTMYFSTVKHISIIYFNIHMENKRQHSSYMCRILSLISMNT